MNYKRKYILLILIVFVSILCANSRVAFSRPQLVYRTHLVTFDMGEGKVSLGFTSEILDLEVSF